MNFFFTPHRFANYPAVLFLTGFLMVASLLFFEGQGHFIEAKPKKQPKIQKPWEDPKKARFDMLSWPQKTNHAMACLIEHTFKEHDSNFRCDDPVRNDLGDPCTNKKDYWTGPTFPTKKSYLVHKSISRIQFKYEHDELRSVKVWLNKPQTLDQLNYLLQLPESYSPSDPHGLPDNVQMVEYLRYHNKLKPGLYDGITISGYDYLGHGKIKCPNGG